MKLIEEKKINEAVLLGESISESEIDIGIKFNLMAAFYFAGQREKAKKKFNTLTDYEISCFPRKVIEEWKIKLEN